RGNALRALYRLPDALESYNQVIRLRPNDANAFSNRAATLQELMRFDEAIASFEQALALRPDDLDVACNLGAALAEQRQFDKALLVLDDVLAKRNGHAQALSGAAFCVTNLCDWDRRTKFEQSIVEHVAKKTIVSPFALLGYSDNLSLQT